MTEGFEATESVFHLDRMKKLPNNESSIEIIILAKSLGGEQQEESESFIIIHPVDEFFEEDAKLFSGILDQNQSFKVSEWCRDQIRLGDSKVVQSLLLHDEEANTINLKTRNICELQAG